MRGFILITAFVCLPALVPNAGALPVPLPQWTVGNWYTTDESFRLQMDIFGIGGYADITTSNRYEVVGTELQSQDKGSVTATCWRMDFFASTIDATGWINIITPAPVAGPVRTRSASLSGRLWLRAADLAVVKESRTLVLDMEVRMGTTWFPLGPLTLTFQTEYDEPLRLLKFPMDTGTSWDQNGLTLHVFGDYSHQVLGNANYYQSYTKDYESSVTGRENRQTQQGTCSTYRVHNAAQRTYTFDEWYCDNAGWWLKQTRNSLDLGSEGTLGNFDLEVTSYLFQTGNFQTPTRTPTSPPLFTPSPTPSQTVTPATTGTAPPHTLPPTPLPTGTPVGDAPYVAEMVPLNGATGVSQTQTLSFHLRDAVEGVDTSSVEIFVNGQQVTDGLSGSNPPFDYLFTYPPPSGQWSRNQVVLIEVTACDLAFNPFCLTGWHASFTVEGDTTSTPTHPPTSTPTPSPIPTDTGTPSPTPTFTSTPSPTPDPANAPYITDFTPPDGETEVSPGASLTFIMRDDVEGLDLSTATLTINGMAVSPTIEAISSPNVFRFRYTPPGGKWDPATTYTVEVTGCDLSTPAFCLGTYRSSFIVRDGLVYPNLMAGYMDTYLRTNRAGEMTLMALSISSNPFTTDVTEVELFLGGSATGVLLNSLGGGTFSIAADMPVQFFPRKFTLELVGRGPGSEGVRETYLWPYLVIE